MKTVDQAVLGAGGKYWAPPSFRPKARQMIENVHPAFRSEMGVVLPLAWGLLARIGLPLILGAGAIAASSALVKSAIPTIPINRDNLGKSSLLGGAGLAAYFIADVVPPGYKGIAYAAAAAGMATSVYLLFSGEETGGKGEAAQPERPTRMSPTETYGKVSAVFESPRLNEEVSAGLFSGDYDVRIIWANNSGRDVEFDHHFVVQETMRTPLGDYAPTKKIVTPDPSRITLRAGESLAKNYEIDVEGGFGWVRANEEVTVEIFNPNVQRWIPVATNRFIVKK